MRTPQDFEFLVKSIYEKTHQLLSVSTLKRLFGYIGPAGVTRRSTLDVLCQYVGYVDWEAFSRQESAAAMVESSPLLADSLCSDELKVGEVVTVCWNPDRECTFRYQGDNRFVVESSRNSRLAPGDTFECHLFVQAEPLYLLRLSMRGGAPVNYVCGKDHGIHFFV